MKEKARKSGLAVIGDIPWGTHICQFYQTKDDVIDIVVPYLKEGLHNNELCIWVVSKPFDAGEIKELLGKAMPHFSDYLKKGQMEIVSHADWYFKEGAFNLLKSLNTWVDKLNCAQASGYAGLRVASGTSWVHKNDWKYLVEYEEESNKLIGSHRMLALCCYSLETCGVHEVLDIVHNHQRVLIRREGAWRFAESSELKRTKQIVANLEHQKAVILDNMSELVAFHDTDMRIVWANKVAAQTVGLTPEELAGHSCFKIWHYRTRSCDDCPVKKALKTGEPQEAEITFVDGETWFIRGYPVRDARGDVVGVVEVALNTTERKRAERQISEHLQFLQTVIDTIPNPIFIKDKNGLYQGCNKAFEQFLGLTKDQIIGRTVYDISPKDLADKYNEMDLALFRHPGVQVYESSVQYADGTRHEVVFNKATYSDTGGALAGLVGVILDISKRKRAEESLWNTLQKLKELEAIINRSPVVLFLWRADEGWPVEFVSDSVWQFGYTSEDFISGRVLYAALVYEEDLDRVATELARQSEEGSSEFVQEYRIRTKAGEVRWVEDHTWVRRNSDGVMTHYQGMLIDITERRQAEDALQTSEERYRSVIDNIGIGVAVISPQMEILSLNNKMKEWFPNVNVGEKPLCYKAFNNPPRYDICMYCPTYKTLQDGLIHESITDTPTEHGVRHYRVVSSPLRDQNGKIAAAIEMVDDITGRESR